MIEDEEFFGQLQFIKDDIRTILSRITTPEKVDLAMLYLNGGLSDENIIIDERRRLTDQRLILAGLTIRGLIFGLISDFKEAVGLHKDCNDPYIYRVCEQLGETCNLLGTRESAQLADIVALEFDFRKLELNYDAIDEKNHELAYEIGLGLKYIFREITCEFRNRRAIAEAEAEIRKVRNGFPEDAE